MSRSSRAPLTSFVTPCTPTARWRVTAAVTATDGFGHTRQLAPEFTSNLACPPLKPSTNSPPYKNPLTSFTRSSKLARAVGRGGRKKTSPLTVALTPLLYRPRAAHSRPPQRRDHQIRPCSALQQIREDQEGRGEEAWPQLSQPAQPPSRMCHPADRRSAAWVARGVTGHGRTPEVQLCDLSGLTRCPAIAHTDGYQTLGPGGRELADRLLPGVWS